MANKERLIQVRDKIIANKDRFYYGKWVTYKDDPECFQHHDLNQKELIKTLETDCGTCGCVGGWTITCMPIPPVFKEVENIAREASDWLDLTTEEFDLLLYGMSRFGFPSLNLNDSTVEDSVARLNFLIERS